jgi:hypothetical protein
MKATPEQLILQQIQALCQGHAQSLRDALQDMALLALTPAQYSQLSKADRRLLDQFAYRYTRLQDDMGTRLMPAVLKALGEDVAPMSPSTVLRGWSNSVGCPVQTPGRPCGRYATSLPMTTPTMLPSALTGFRPQPPPPGNCSP